MNTEDKIKDLARKGAAITCIKRILGLKDHQKILEVLNLIKTNEKAHVKTPTKRTRSSRLATPLHTLEKQQDT